MRLHKALAAAAISAACIIPFSGLTAGAADSTSLTVVDGNQYSSASLMAHTICVDDVIVQSGERVINSAIDTTPGTHTVKMTDGVVASCDADVEWTTGSVELLATQAQTLVIGWPGWVDQAYVLNATVFADDLSCTDAGNGRIVFRNVNSAGITASFGSVTDTLWNALIAGVTADDEGTATVPAGTFPSDPDAVAAAWQDDEDYLFASDFDALDVAEGTVTFVYSYAGNDGPIGLTSVVQNASVCDVPVTTETTTTPTTTPTTAPIPTTLPVNTGAVAAVPVAAQPTYTG